jgi:hypothetical protein
MAIAHFHPKFFRQMFFQPVCRPAPKNIAIIAGTIANQFLQALQICLIDCLRATNRTFLPLVRHPSTRYVHPMPRGCRTTPQCLTNFRLRFALICQQHNFQALTIRLG